MLAVGWRKMYFSGQFNGYLQQMGIWHEFSCRYTPEQNGVAERKNRLVVEAARAMLGRGGKDRGIHPEPERRQSVGTRVVFRNKDELATLEGVQ